MFPVYALTLKQLIRQSHLWYIILFAIISIEIAPAFAELFTFGKTELAVIDALQATFFMIVLLSVVSSSYSLLGKELNQRIAMTLLTKPIHYQKVIYAKYLALLTSLVVISFFLGLCILKQAWVLEWQNLSIKLAFYSVVGIFFQGTIILSLSMALSIVLGPLYAVLLTLALTFAGFFFPIHLIKYVCFIIPAMPWFDLSVPIYSQTDIPIWFMGKLILYSVTYSGLMLYLSKLSLERKEF